MTAQSFDPYLPELRAFAMGILAMWRDIAHSDDVDWWHSIQVKDRMFDVNLYCDSVDRDLTLTAYFVSPKGNTITDNYFTLVQHRI